MTSWTTTRTVFGGGLNVGFAGFTRRRLVGRAEQHGSLMTARGWDAGVAYETGPWGISFTYFNGENVDDEAVADGFLGADEEAGAVPARHQLRSGQGRRSQRLRRLCRLRRGCRRLYRRPTTATTTIDDDDFINPGGDDVDGWVVGTGIKISF